MIRKIKFPDDLDILIPFLVEAFKYPENPEWHAGTDEIEGYVDLIKAAKKFWPILSVLRIFSSYVRNVYTGMVWEEEGKVIGIISLQQLSDDGDWFGRNLAILPEYRKKRIGQKLFMAAVKMILEENGKRAYLLVIDGNKPAITLYEKMGFIDYTSETVLEHPGTGIPELPAHDAPFSADKRSIHDWKKPYEHACLTMPDDVKEYETINIEDFKLPLYRKIADPIFYRSQGTEAQTFDYRRTGNDEIVGQATIELRVKEGGAVIASAANTQGNAEMAKFMMQHILTMSAKHSPKRKIRMDVPGWQPEIIEAALEAGFEKKLVYRKMVGDLPKLFPEMVIG